MPSRTPPKRPRLAFLIAAIAIGLLGCIAVFVLGDMAVYWWGALRGESPVIAEIKRRSQRGPGLHEETPDGGKRLRRYLDDVVAMHQVSRRRTSLRTNALGFRGPPVGPKPADEFRILALGDSITLGHYVEEPETYPARLEAILNRIPRKDKKRYRVINAAVDGIALAEEVRILLETGLLTQPDVVLVGLYLNDAEASTYYRPPDGLLGRTAIGRRLHFSEVARELELRGRRMYEDLSGKPFPTTPFPEGAWRTRREAFDAEIAKAMVDWGNGYFQESWDVMRPDLRRLRDLAAEHGFDLLVALFPATPQVEAEFLADEPQRMFLKIAADLNIRHLDLLPALRTAYRAQGRSLAYDQCHLNPEGNTVAARAIAEFLLADN